MMLDTEILANGSMSKLMKLSTRTRFLLLVSSFVLNFGLFHLLTYGTGKYLFMFMIIPVIVASVLYGTRIGHLSNLTVFIISIILFLFLERYTNEVILRLASVTLLNLLVAATLGKFRDISYKLISEIDKRKNAELEKSRQQKRLIDSERLFRRLFEEATVGFYRIKPNGKILMANPALIKILGCPTENYLFNSTFEEKHIGPKYRNEEFSEHLDKYGRIIAMEEEWVRFDGSTCYMEESAWIIYDENDNIQYYDGLVVDVTVRKLAEIEIKEYNAKLEQEIDERRRTVKNLKESEMRFRNLVEKAGIAICISDPDGKFLYFNKQFSGLFGYFEEEVNSSIFNMFVHQDDRELVNEWFSERFQGYSNQTRNEFRGLRKDGTVINLEVESTMVRKDNEIIGIRSYIWDISDRISFENILRESEERFRSMFENATLGMFRKDLQGKLLMANPMLLQFLSSLSFEQLAIFSPESEESIQTYEDSEFKKLIDENDKLIGYEEKWQGWDDTTYTVRLSVWTIRDASGQPLYYDGIVEDITAEKRALAEKELAEYELKKAEKELKVLSGLLPICSHCKRIRDEENSNWLPVEEYIDDHSEAEFSHGLCPDCMQALYPGVLPQS